MDPIREAEVAQAIAAVSDHMMQMEITALEAIIIAGALQLALRHPQASEMHRRIVEQFVRDIQATLAQVHPGVGQIIEEGFQPPYELQTHPDRKCRVCGCTEAKACPGGCHWVEPNLCSACESAARSIIVA